MIDPTTATANCHPAREEEGGGKLPEAAGLLAEVASVVQVPGMAGAGLCGTGGGGGTAEALLEKTTMESDAEAENTTLVPETPNQSSVENAMSPGSVLGGLLEL